MYINKTAITYKFLDEAFLCGFDGIPDNLCAYIRKVIGMIIVTFILYGVVITLGVCAILTPIMLFNHGFMWDYLGLYVFGIVVWSVVIYSVIRIFLMPGIKKTIFNTTAKIANTHSGTVFGAWIKAIHDKVCPMLTFMEESK